MPSATAVRARRRAPSNGAGRVDWQHPYAHRLQGLWLPQGTNRFRNLVNENDSLANGGAAGIVAEVNGWGVATGETDTAPGGGANRGFTNSAPSASLKPANAVTLLWIGSVRGNASATNRRIASMEHNSADGPPYISYGIYRETTTTGVAFSCSQGGTFTTRSTTPITNGPADQAAMAVLTYDRDQLKAYWNGSFISGAGFTGALAYDSSAYFTIGSHATAAGAPNVLCNMVAVWDRALSAEEIAELYADPFQLLLTGGRRAPLITKGPAATSPTGSAAITLAAFTSSASGTETLTGSAAVTLAAFTSSASGTVSFTGTSANTLAAFTGSATGTVAQSVTGTAAITLESFTSTAVGVAPTVQDTVSHDVRTGQPDPRWRDRRRATWPPPLKTRGSNYGRY